MRMQCLLKLLKREKAHKTRLFEILVDTRHADCNGVTTTGLRTFGLL